MLEIKKKTIVVRYEGTDYTVRAPSNRELKEFEGNELKDLEKIIAFLDTLGLPEAIGWEIDPESLAQVIESIAPKKKN